jgi:hypothetical protein
VSDRAEGRATAATAGSEDLRGIGAEEVDDAGVDDRTERLGLIDKDEVVEGFRAEESGRKVTSGAEVGVVG